MSTMRRLHEDDQGRSTRTCYCAQTAADIFIRLSTLSRPPGKATHSRIMIANGQATPGGRRITDDDVMAKRLPEAKPATRMTIDEKEEGEKGKG